MVITMTNESIFQQCSLAPVDPVLSLTVAYKADSDSRKVDLGVGAYRDDDGRPHIFQAIKLAEEAIFKDSSNNHEYTRIDGDASLKNLTLSLMISPSVVSSHESRIVSCQAISGTGALRVCAEFLSVNCKPPSVLISDPTWANHRAIFQRSGLTVSTYPYWNTETKSVDINGWLSVLERAEPGSVVVLHACAHNPTGSDPSQSEIIKVIDVILKNRLVPLVDNAYQGYATGDMDGDAFMIRELFARGAEFFVTQSFAKNMGLYGERFGMVHVFTKNAEIAERVLSQMKVVIRPMYSSPPVHGAKLVQRVLSDPHLKQTWLDELHRVSSRIKKVRRIVAESLSERTGQDWSHIEQQIGMFSYTDLSPAQCDRMISHWHIYLMRNGRISVAGINSKNVEYVVAAIEDCVKNA